MPEELEAVLRLVADGRLTPEEAAPIIDALTRTERRGPTASAVAGERTADTGKGSGRHLRIRVTERGRQVVNLRIPIGFVDSALQLVPGLAGDQTQRIRDAVRTGTSGPIVDVEEPDGSGVLITID